MTKTPEGSGKLLRWELDNQTAAQCLTFAAGPLKGQCDKGFAYTAGSCRFCVVDVGEDSGPVLRERGTDGAPGKVETGNAFELRLFGEHFELRWTRTNGLEGRMSICTEDAAFAELLSDDNLAHCGLPALERRDTKARWLDHGYLLWGQSTGGNVDEPDWTQLTSARIGGLWVPVGGVRSKARLALKAREYFTVADAGNVVFAGERLFGFAEVGDTKAQGNGEANVR